MNRLFTLFGVTLPLLTMLVATDAAQAAGLGTIPSKGQPPAGPDGNTRVWRVQLNLQVCDVANAGTDNKVLAALNDANYTVLDTTVDDFERATVRTYDVLLNGVSTLSDIKYLKIFKGGSDGVCLSQLSMLVNERLIYAQSIAPTRQWLDSEYYGYDSRSLSIAGTTLRSSSVWQAWSAPSRPHLLSAAEIGARLATAVGTGMYDFNVESIHSLSWDHAVCGGLGLCVTALDATTITVELGLRFKCVDPTFGDGACGDVLIVYEHDLHLSCSGGVVTVTPGAHNGYTLPTNDSAGGFVVTAADEISAVHEFVVPRFAEAFRNIAFPTCPAIAVHPLSTLGEARVEVQL